MPATRKPPLTTSKGARLLNFGDGDAQQPVMPGEMRYRATALTDTNRGLLSNYSRRILVGGRSGYGPKSNRHKAGTGDVRQVTGIYGV